MLMRVCAGMAAIGSGRRRKPLVSAMMGAAIAADSSNVGMEPLSLDGPVRSYAMPHGTTFGDVRVMQVITTRFLEMSAAHDRYHAAMMRSARLGCPPAIAIEMESLSGSPAGRPRRHSSGRHLRSAAPGLPEGDRPRRIHRKLQNAPVTPSVSPSRRTGAKAALSACTAASPPSCSLGMTFHIPPALRIYGRSTVGVSETVVVTETPDIASWVPGSPITIAVRKER